MIRKQPSGCRKRKRAKEKRIEALRAEAAELGLAVVNPTEVLRDDDADGAQAFAELGAPPVENPDLGLLWVRRAQLVGLGLALTRPLHDGLTTRLKWLQQLAAVTGMTHSRAALEHRLAGVEDALDQTSQRQRSAVAMKPTAGVMRSPNARGSYSRRPRAVDAAAAPGGEEE